MVIRFSNYLIFSIAAAIVSILCFSLYYFFNEKFFMKMLYTYGIVNGLIMVFFAVKKIDRQKNVFHEIKNGELFLVFDMMFGFIVCIIFLIIYSTLFKDVDGVKNLIELY